MPTIKQLPVAASVSGGDVIPVSQGGTTRSLTVAGLLSSTQPALSLVPGKLLGRASLVAGGPEALSVGTGLSLAGGVVAATGDDHVRLPVVGTLTAGDEVVVNSAGAAKRMPAGVLRGLFKAGSGIAIDDAGTISAPSAGVPGPPGPVVPATPTAIGAVRPGSGFAVSPDGTLLADPVALPRAIGLGTAAVRDVGLSAGTVAAGDDVRLVSAQSGTQVAAAIQAALADGSSVGVTAVGGAVARTLAARVGEAASVLDQVGTDRTGVVDCSPGFGAAALRASAVGTTVTVPPGRYRLGGVPSIAPNQSWDLTGTLFSGPGVIVGSGDWSPFLAHVAKGMIKTTNQAGNEFGSVSTLGVGVTGATIGYEKAAGYDYAYTTDPSTPTVSKDVVGRQMTGVVMTGNASGRAWGFVSQGAVLSGADGAAAGGEINVVNNGSNQAVVGTGTSKTGLGVIAFGSAPSTAAVVIAPGSQAFHHGVFIRGDSVLDSAMRVTNGGSFTDDVFQVRVTGEVMTPGLVSASGGRALGVQDAAGAVNYVAARGGAVGTPAVLTTAGAGASQDMLIQPTGMLTLTAAAVVVNGGLFLGSDVTAYGNLSVSGVLSAPTAAPGTSTTQVATMAALQAGLAGRQAAGGTTQATRTVTAAGPVTVLAADGTVVIKKAAAAATAVTLEASPVTGAVHTIKDGRGDAATNAITISAASGTIDGQASLVIGTNRGSVRLLYSGAEWMAI